MHTIKADAAQVAWDAQKKTWTVRIQVGEEVMKRAPETKIPHDATDDQLRGLAVEIVKGDGYEIDPAAVTIER